MQLTKIKLKDNPTINFDSVEDRQAIAWFLAKSIMPSFDWQDVSSYEHQVAFTVAKMINYDLLNDVKELLDRSIIDGTDFAEFKKNLVPKLKQNGWWGKNIIVDPADGMDKIADLGSDHRLKIIYNTNMRTARAAGKWDRIQQTRQALPYLIYVRSHSLTKRYEHLDLVGTCLPASDPFWSAYMPPNGHGCKCTVRQMTKRAAEKVGISESKPIEYENWFNKRTKQSFKVPKGITPGFDNNHMNRLASLDEAFKNKIISNKDDLQIAERIKTLRSFNTLMDINDKYIFLDKDWIMKKIAENPDAMEKAITNMPKYQNDTIRKLSLDDKIYDRFSTACKAGNYIRFSNFTSTAMDEESFFESNVNVKIFFKKHRGVDMSKISFYPEEKEVIMSRNDTYKVLEVFYENNVLEIYLKQELVADESVIHQLSMRGINGEQQRNQQYSSPN